MKAVLDACVLYPTVLREILTGAASAGFYRPLWSERILEEWARAARRISPAAEAIARGEIAVLKARWPGAMVAPSPGTEARLWLPDPSDIHVLAVAVAGSADLVVTLNARDFPRHALAEEGLDRRDPDALLTGFLAADATAMAQVVAAVHAEAERLAGTPLPLRALLRRAGLPRLGKALG